VVLDGLISPRLKCAPRWGWKILDLSFWHAPGGPLPTPSEVQLHARIFRNVVRGAMRIVLKKEMAFGRGCEPVLDEEGKPRYGPHGWPLGKRPSGKVVELRLWMAIQVRRAVDLWTHRKGLERKIFEEVWRLRPGWIVVRCGEFGFDHTNHHYHGCAFMPWVPIKLLSKLFKQESRKLLGVESHRVLVEHAKKTSKDPTGFRGALAHTLKYTAKLPASNPEGLARLEAALDGTRVVELMGVLRGVELPKPEKGSLRCPNCKSKTAILFLVERFVSISAVAHLPDVPEEVAVSVEDFEENVFAGRAP
jgi:hypothetical protein